MGIVLRSASGTKFSSGTVSYGSHSKSKARFLEQTLAPEETYCESQAG